MLLILTHLSDAAWLLLQRNVDEGILLTVINANHSQPELISACLLLASSRLTDVGLTRMWPTRPGWTAQTSFSQEPTNGHWTSAWHWLITTAATSPFTSTMCKYPTRGLTPAASRQITSPVSPTSTSLSKVRRWAKMVQWECVKTANLPSHLHDITAKLQLACNRSASMVLWSPFIQTPATWPNFPFQHPCTCNAVNWLWLRSTMRIRKLIFSEAKFERTFPS